MPWRGCMAILVGLSASVWAETGVRDRHPVYVGVSVCTKCHRGPQAGHTFSKWRNSAHAVAYVVLWNEESKEIARLSGITEEPQEAATCLGCHATASDAEAWEKEDTFDPADGVQCEKCHGPGSEYLALEVMKNPAHARANGLIMPKDRACRMCHNAKGSHTAVLESRPFDLAKAKEQIAHRKPTGGSAEPKKPYLERPYGRPSHNDQAASRITRPKQIADSPTAVRYKTPLNLAVSQDGRELYLTCEASDSVIVVDVVSRRKVAEIDVAGQPNDVTFSPNGELAYVTNRLGDSLSVIDVKQRRLVRTVPVGDEPHGVLLDHSGKRAYVLNTASSDISVLDVATLKEVKRLSASRGPWSLAASPDGEVIAVTNVRSRFVPFREPALSEITIINAADAFVENRVVLPGVNLVQGIAWHPSGRFALVTLNRTKNLIPMTRLLQGWTKTNGLGIVWRDGRTDQVLLDWPDWCFPDPADVAISPDGKYAFVTSSGSDRVAVVDVDKMIGMLKAASDDERERVFPNHLGKPTEFIIKHIPTKNSPRGVVFSPDGNSAFVANALDDSITVIDVATLEAVERIDLGGPQTITQTRWGERLFHSADVTFRRQFSCHTCHPDGHIEGLTYDIEPDGIGQAPVDNRTLRGILDTAPFKWEGTNPSLQRQCGPRLAVFFTRIDPFTPEELAALDRYICTIPRPPNRYRAVGGKLTPAQRRGKAVFDRKYTNGGQLIPEDNRCVTCHFPPLFTDRTRRDVGTKMWLDHTADFDVPHLNNIYDSAPYLHNGIAPTLEEIWTIYNPHDQHGVTNDMTKDQLNDLIEYLKTL